MAVRVVAMKRVCRIIAMFTFVGAMMCASAGHAHPLPTQTDKCVCKRARVENGWCGKCGVGYIGGLKIPSKMLYEEIDPHGHDIDPKRIQCLSCRAAIAKDGFCRVCNIGFVHGQAYLSKLAYRLALGRRIDPDKLTCPVCRTNAQSYGWCEKCGKGFVGAFLFTDKATFEAAVAARKIIEAAVRELKHCKFCAAAIVCNGYCPRCKKRFCDGHVVTEKENEEAKSPPERDASQSADND